MAAKKKTSKKKTAVKAPTKRKATAPRNIILDVHVRIATVIELKALLEKFLPRKQITIDAAKTEKIDTSALQLLTAFMLEAKKRSIKVKWQSPSAALQNAAKLLGLSQHLQLPPSAE